MPPQPPPLAPDLGIYVLPGRTSDPRPGIEQAQAAERIGLGSIWIAERWERKEIGAICGAMAQATTRVRIAAGMTHFGTRHPIVLAGLGATMQALSGNRFMLGIARSSPAQWRALGLPPPTLAALADHADILRALWNGDRVEYAGAAGSYPDLRLPDAGSYAPPPLLLAAIGPKMLELAGRAFDGVVLHPFLTPEAVGRSARTARAACAAAGRDPAAFKVHAAVVAAPDFSTEERLLAVEGRAVTYFSIPDVGRQIIAANGWDEAPMHALLSDPDLANLEFQKVDHDTFRQRIGRAAALMPADWARSGAATGTAGDCARRLKAYRAAGADEIVLHGAVAGQVEALVRAYAAMRDTPAVPED